MYPIRGDSIMKLLKIDKTIIAMTLLLSMATAQVSYNVSGVALLDGVASSGDHSGIKIAFYNLPSVTPEDSTTTSTNGAFSINISPGYYLVEWTKTGYVPWELGGLSLAANVVLDSVTMIAGEVSEVSGTINTTTWTTGYVYYVTDDITVPSGETLTINAGVRVKFYNGKGMTVNGNLLANGTAENHILFTSKEPTPLPGDWSNIDLNGRDNNLTYVDYKYATDGITGSNVDHTTIDHITIQGNLSTSARGIYFQSGDSLTITNNYFSVQGDYGIYASNANYSNITNNTIITPSYGIRAHDCDNCSINENDINSSDGTTGPTYGISADNSSNIDVLNNTMVARAYAIYVPYSFKATINQNKITGQFYQDGIHFANSDSSTVMKNNITRTSSFSTGGWTYMINAASSEGSIIKKDTLISPEAYGSYDYTCGIFAESSTIDSNYIQMYAWDDYYYGIYGNNSTISNNYILLETYVDDRGTNYAIIRAPGSNVNSIINNTIINNHRGFDGAYGISAGSNKTIRNNTINCNFMRQAFYVEHDCIVDSNTVSGEYNRYLFEINGDSTLIKDNSVNISGSSANIWLDYQNYVQVYNNKFFNSGSGRFLESHHSEVYLTGNIFEGNSGRGVYLTNQASGKVYNNTLVSTDAGDYGVIQTNQTNVPIYNNIITGFNSGVYVENTIQNYNINNNLLWDIDGSTFSGTALPPLAGQMIDENPNGLAADIYNNLYLDPLFVHPDTNNYSLQAGSPAVNAGTASLSDPDGSVSDIGANYHHIYVVMGHTALGNTNNTAGPYRVNATLSSSSGATVTGSVYYAIDGGSYTELSMTAASNDTFYADIPGQALNTTIQYYVSGSDGVNTSTLPYNLSEGGYSFFVSLFNQFANMNGSSNSDGEIVLAWGTPVPLTGALTGLKLYKGTSANIALTAGNLYQEFAASVTSYTDTETAEGVTYYYKLTGTLDSATEALVSAETATMSNNATTVRVAGQALLSDATDHSGVKVLMVNRYTPAIRDSVVTDLTGVYSRVMQTGIYNIHFSKDGYQPDMIGNQTFPGTEGNMDLDTTTIIPGGSLVLDGEISGTLLSSNVHFVDGDITVAEEDTLVIQPGTVLKFRGEYELVVNGNIQALGTAEAPIVFTSGKAQILSGDWKRLTLNDADSSVLRYCSFKYSIDGVFLKNNNHHTEITHCTFENMLTNSRAITCRDYASGSEYSSGNDSLIISYNKTDAVTHYGLYLRESRGSQFVGNDFQGYYGFECSDCDGSSIKENTIQSSQFGMNCYSCQGSTISNNEIYPFEDGYIEWGLYAEHCDDCEIKNNTVLGFFNRGINMYSSDRVAAMNNAIADTNKQGNYRNEGGNYGISYDDVSTEIANQCTIRNNNIYILGRDNIYGLRGQGALVDSNTITVVGNIDYARGIYSSYSRIFDNTIYSISDGEGRGIESYANSANPSTIKRNIVYALNNSRAFLGDYAHLEDNVFYGADSDHFLWGLSEDSPPTTSNSFQYNWAVSDGPNLVVINNKFYDFGYGVGVNGESCVIKNNVFRLYRNQGFSIYSGTNTVVQKNSITLRGMGSDIDYGMRFYDSNVSNVFGNTIASQKSSTTGTGISIYGSASPQINSNIVYNFGTGINAQSATYVLKYNLIVASTAMTGDGLPDQAGVTATVNYNADPSDIYSNITASPVFLDLDSSTAIGPTSAAINAGDVDSLDLDGTIADIGSDFYNFGYAPYRLTADSTGDGSVSLSWTIVATDSLSGYNPYYRVSGTDDWTFEPTYATSNQTIEITGLTNNTTYDFAVSAQYLITESNKSSALKEKPGIPSMSISTNYLIAKQEAGDTSIVEYTITNNGTKDLTYSATFKTDLGVVTYNHPQYPNVSDPSDWDVITETVAITRSTSRGIYNPILESNYERGGDWSSPEGTLWAWGPTEGNTNTYTFWRSAVNQSGCGNPRYTLRDENCGTPIMSLYLVEDNYYFDVEWHDWQAYSNNATFSYTRTHLPRFSSTYYDGGSGTVLPGEFATLSDSLSNSENGIYSGLFEIRTNDTESLVDTVYRLNIVGPQSTLPSTNFTPVDTTAEEFYYVITSASIDGYGLETGDEVALFSGATCVGAGMYNGVMPFLVRAFGENPPDDTGFSNGDSITVKAWDFGESRVAAMTATLETGSTTFINGGFAEVTLTGTIYYNQEITIQSGMFNLISYYLYPKTPSSSTIFGGLSNLHIVYEDDGAALIPEYGINTIGDIDLTEGYHLFADGDNQTLTIEGLSIDPADWSINLAPNQFNSVAFLYDGPMDAEQAMAAIDTLIEIVQDDAGGAWIPSFGATIGNLIPGKGYQVFTTVDTAISFTYAPYQAPAARSMLAVAKPQPVHFSFRRTGAPYTIVLQSAVIDGHILEPGDEVAVYDGDICVGAVVWSSNDTNVLTAWRGDKDLELPGYRAGNTMSFQVYKTRFKETVLVNASFTDEAHRVFDGSSYSRVSLRGSPGLIPQQFALEQNYPNPFNPVTNIGYHVAEDAPVTMVIYNLMGQEVVRLLDNKIHAPGKYNLVWQATNQKGENVSAGVYLIHMYSTGFAKTKKMVLLK